METKEDLEKYLIELDELHRQQKASAARYIKYKEDLAKIYRTKLELEFKENPLDAELVKRLADIPKYDLQDGVIRKAPINATYNAYNDIINHLKKAEEIYLAMPFFDTISFPKIFTIEEELGDNSLFARTISELEDKAVTYKPITDGRKKALSKIEIQRTKQIKLIRYFCDKYHVKQKDFLIILDILIGTPNKNFLKKALETKGEKLQFTSMKIGKSPTFYSVD